MDFRRICQFHHSWHLGSKLAISTPWMFISRGKLKRQWNVALIHSPRSLAFAREDDKGTICILFSIRLAMYCVLETITSKKAALTPMIKRLNWWIYLVTHAVSSIKHLISPEFWRILEPFLSNFKYMFVSPVNSTTCKPRFLPKSLLITIAFPAISLRCAIYTAQMTLWQCHLYYKEPLE